MSLGRTRGQRPVSEGTRLWPSLGHNVSNLETKQAPLLQNAEVPASLWATQAAEPRTRTPNCPRSVMVPAAPSSLRGPLNVWSGGTRLCGEVLDSKKMHFHLPASGPHRPLNPCSPGARPGGLSPPPATWERVPALDQPKPCAQTCLRAAPPLCWPVFSLHGGIYFSPHSSSRDSTETLRGRPSLWGPVMQR